MILLDLFYLNFWRIFLLDIKFRVDSFFPFSSLKILWYCVLTSMVPNEKSIVIWITGLLYVSFSLIAFNTCALFIVFRSLITMCLSRAFFTFIKFIIRFGWDCWIFFTNYGVVFGHYSFNYFFCPNLFLFSFGDPIIYMLDILIIVLLINFYILGTNILFIICL